MNYLLNPTIPQVLHTYGTLGSTELDYESTMEMTMRAHATDLNNISWPEPLDAHTGMVASHNTYREIIFPYWNHPATQPYLHRQMAHLNTDDQPSTIQDFCKDKTTVFLKTVTKGVSTSVDVSQKDIYQWFLETDMFGYMPPAWILLSENVDFTWERRFFIVDGHVIDHSPRILKATPALPDEIPIDYHHLGAPRFDTNDNPVIPEEDPYVDMLLETAHTLAREIPQLAYALDLGITYDTSGAPRPTIVETNPIFNSGFYWADVYTIWPALAQAIDTHGTSTLFREPPRLDM